MRYILIALCILAFFMLIIIAKQNKWQQVDHHEKEPTSIEPTTLSELAIQPDLKGNKGNEISPKRVEGVTKDEVIILPTKLEEVVSQEQVTLETDADATVLPAKPEEADSQKQAVLETDAGTTVLSVKTEEAVPQVPAGNKKKHSSKTRKKADIDSLDYITITGLNEKEIKKKKNALIKKHIEKTVKNLDYSPSEKEKILASRIFFVHFEDKLVLCGTYKAKDRYDAIDACWREHYKTYDYLLFSKKSGFFFVNDCNEPIFTPEPDQNISPSLFCQAKNDVPYIPIEYGKTYESDELLNIQIKYSVKTYHASEKYYSYEFIALINQKVACSINDVTEFSELPLDPGWVLYTKEKKKNKNHPGQKTAAQLLNYVENINYPIAWKVGSIMYNDKTLSYVIACREEQKHPVSDHENIYFYFSKNSKTDSFEFDVIMQCANIIGEVYRFENLLPFDSTVNYRIAIPKKAPRKNIVLINSIIHEAKDMNPAILDCPIHDIIDALWKDSQKTYPQNDNASIENTIYLIKKVYGDLPNWKLIDLIISNYGSATLSKNSLYWEYDYLGLRCGYLPETVRQFLGEKKYVELAKKYNDKATSSSSPWTSEYSLYKLVLLYFSDAIYHYYSNWLGNQHIDIFIPSKQIAFEFQGEQHYTPIDYFGGEQGFIERQFLDEKKRVLCKENNVVLIEWPYSTPITADNLITLLINNGLTEIPIPDPFREPEIIEKNVPEKKVAISIRQYDLNGKLYKCFSNYNDASESSGVSIKAIVKAIDGYTKTAGGYQWRRETEDAPHCDIAPLIYSTNTGLSKPVFQVSLDGEIIAEYPSITKASKATGINTTSISCVLNGTQKTAGKYYWVYKEE